MKKFILVTITSFCLTSFLQAQIAKGSVLLGGSIGANRSKVEYSTPNTNEGENKGITVSPSVGVAVADNTVIGIEATYSRLKSEQFNAPYTSEGKNYGGGIFVRRYMTLGKGFYLFGQSGFNYSRLKSEQIFSNQGKSTGKQSAFSVYICPGVTYAVSKRFHLEASLNNLATMSYTRSKEESNSNGALNTQESKNFYVSSNLSVTNPLSIGCRFVLAK